jgi:cyclophilin family peptidyl-prolyl cis-trans isomerase
VVVNAVRALQMIADSTCSSCTPALARLLSHGHPYVRATAAAAFADRFIFAAADSAPRRAALDTLGARLRDRDAATRGAAARALMVHAGEHVLAPVEAMLADTSVYARTAAMRALALAPPARVTPRLLAVLDQGPHLFDRMTAAEALAGLRAREALPRLREGLRDSTLLMVAACASALGEMGDSASVPALVRANAARAGDADADARISIRDALRHLRGAAFADSLERAHPPTNARRAALAADFAEPPPERGAVIHTSAGDIEWAFHGDVAPQTVRNFVRLARQGYFDGTAFHRVVPNFVIQDGDPTGTGSGGPGYTIRCEYNQLRYDPGMVGMALSGKDTGGSQWFITHSPQPHLNGRYTIFARVVRGMEVVHRVVQGDRILSVEILL